MYHKAADMRLLIGWPWILIAISLLTGMVMNILFSAGKVPVTVASDASSVVYHAEVESGSEITLAIVGSTSEVMGRVEWLEQGIKYVPVVPFIAGQVYRLTMTAPAGKSHTVEFTVPLAEGRPPTVTMLPQATLPANALKLYLHFSEPMEQGIFLDCLTLFDETGKVVHGPFRETELWSPDGKRLTVWFHPGRQKTGVNLNEEEGPVLHPGKSYTLRIHGKWRSTSGVPLGEEVSLPFHTGASDHTMPNMERWVIQAPKAGTLAPLKVQFDEPLDPAMLTSALTLWRDGMPLPITVTTAPTAETWTATMETAWEAGRYELRADPLLEDLAGNNLLHPFEQDATAPVAEAPRPSVSRVFEIQ